MTTTDQQLTTAESAALLGIKPGSFRSYVNKGVMPKPDGYFGTTPWWYRATITTADAARPGQGKGGGRPRKVVESS